MSWEAGVLASVGVTAGLWPGWFHSVNHERVQGPVAGYAGITGSAAEAVQPRYPGAGSQEFRVEWGLQLKQHGVGQRAVHSVSHRGV